MFLNRPTAVNGYFLTSGLVSYISNVLSTMEMVKTPIKELLIQNHIYFGVVLNTVMSRSLSLSPASELIFPRCSMGLLLNQKR